MVRLLGTTILIETLFSMVLVEKTAVLGFEADSERIKVVLASGNVGVVKYIDGMIGESVQDDSRALMTIITGELYEEPAGPDQYHFRDERVFHTQSN